MLVLPTTGIVLMKAYKLVHHLWGQAASIHSALPPDTMVATVRVSHRRCAAVCAEPGRCRAAAVLECSWVPALLDFPQSMRTLRKHHVE